jgi:hypothetical protein
VRDGAAAYLEKLRASVTENPDSDRPYPFGDRANALSTALRESCRTTLVVDGLSAGGPDEIGPWYILLQELAARHKALTLAVRTETPPKQVGLTSRLPLLAVQQAGATLLRVREGAPPPPYGLFAAESDGRMVAFHWGEPARTTALDSETHRRELWYNRSARHLAQVEAAMTEWLQRYTTEMPLRETVPDGYQIHAIPKGAKIDFASVFRTALQAPIEGVVLQDPYLATEHQLKCLKDLLRVIVGPTGRSGIPFELRTHLSEPDLKDRLSIPTVRHLPELKGLFESHPALVPNILLQRRRLHALHMRFIVFTIEGGRRNLYILERGLDIEDPKTGRARGETYILEFAGVPIELAPLLGLS